MNRRVLGLLASLALATVGTFLVLSYVNDADERAAAGEERVNVLVVTQLVEAGEAASDLAGKVETVQVPALTQAAGAVASLADLGDRVASVQLLPGEQLLDARFVTAEELIEASGVEVPDDMLEVTVSLAPDRAMGGLARPGDLVAVLASFEPFELGAVEPGSLEQVFGTLGGVVNTQLDLETPTANLKTPNSTHIIIHKALVTAVQIERLPAAPDREDAEAVGVELAPTGNLLISLALDAPAVERVVFSAEHGTVWLAKEPPAAPEAGTQIQTRGTVYQ